MSEVIVVHPLTPTRVDDDLAFFDGPAFSDNPRWASCYSYFHHNPEPDRWESRSGPQNRSAVAELIRRGRFHGFLAYRGGTPVGWCNASPRKDVPALGREPDLAYEDFGRIGSIVCFVVAQEHRRVGVARALLQAACRSFLELYGSMGFTPFRELDGWTIVRKAL